MEMEELFYRKAEEDLGEYVDMILGIEEHFMSQYSSPTRYMQWMCDYERMEQNIYDSILEDYECDCCDIGVEEKIIQGFDYSDLGSSIVYLTDKLLAYSCPDGYEIWDNKNNKRFLTRVEKEIFDSIIKLILDMRLREAYELVLTIDSGKYGGE